MWIVEKPFIDYKNLLHQTVLEVPFSMKSFHMEWWLSLTCYRSSSLADGACFSAQLNCSLSGAGLGSYP